MKILFYVLLLQSIANNLFGQNLLVDEATSIAQNTQFNILLGILVFITILFLTLFLSLRNSVQKVKKQLSETGKDKSGNAVDLIKDLEDRLKKQEESLGDQSIQLQSLEKKVSDSIPPYNPPDANEAQENQAVIAPISTDFESVKSSQTNVYAQHPLNGVFIRWSEQFTPRQTIFQIEPDPQRQNVGQFTLVSDVDTLQIAFNIPDTYLPGYACEIRSSGGQLSTQRNWKILDKGTVELQGGVWRINKPMVIQFD